MTTPRDAGETESRERDPDRVIHDGDSPETMGRQVGDANRDAADYWTDAAMGAEAADGAVRMPSLRY